MARKVAAVLGERLRGKIIAVLGLTRPAWARCAAHRRVRGGSVGWRENLYDRMKTVVDGLVIYNRALLDLAGHYGFQPREKTSI
jgi:hypothetical protein